MPARNIIKTYLVGGYYHIYNRGVEKREIFLDEQDCKVFLHYLKLYLLPEDELRQLANIELRINRFIPLNLSKEMDLLSFSLMPNHFHLEVKQYTKNAITLLTRRLSTSYVMYFNRKYHRVGALFQNNYKACLLETDSFLLHLSRYIHLNPFGLNSPINFNEFSSYPYYLGHKKASWIKPQEILSFFRSMQNRDNKDILSYQSFVEDCQENEKDILEGLLLEDND